MTYCTGTTPETLTIYGSIPDNYGNISNFHALSDAERAELGFYVCHIITPDHDPETQVIDGDVRTFDAEAKAWTITKTVRAMTAAELADRCRAQRAAEYPDFRAYLDGMAKASSADPTIRAAGEAQVAAYYAECLAVKAARPLPVEGAVNA